MFFVLSSFILFKTNSNSVCYWLVETVFTRPHICKFFSSNEREASKHVFMIGKFGFRFSCTWLNSVFIQPAAVIQGPDLLTTTGAPFYTDYTNPTFREYLFLVKFFDDIVRFSIAGAILKWNELEGLLLQLSSYFYRR